VLIVGLGNPGSEYEETRHNAGFKAVELLVDSPANEYSSGWKTDKKFGCRIASVRISNVIEGNIIEGALGSNRGSTRGSTDIKVIEPLQYMNRSGEATRKVFDFFKDTFANSKIKYSGSGNSKNSREDSQDFLPLIVVYDELDFDPGIVKVRFKGSAGGHKGLADIIRIFGRDDFFRIRIGIGHPRRSLLKAGIEPGEVDVSSWVLGKPGKADRELFNRGVRKAEEVCRVLITRGYEAASAICGDRSKAGD